MRGGINTVPFLSLGLLTKAFKHYVRDYVTPIENNTRCCKARSSKTPFGWKSEQKFETCTHTLIRTYECNVYIGNQRRFLVANTRRFSKYHTHRNHHVPISKRHFASRLGVPSVRPIAGHFPPWHPIKSQIWLVETDLYAPLYMKFLNGDTKYQDNVYDISLHGYQNFMFIIIFVTQQVHLCPWVWHPWSRP